MKGDQLSDSIYTTLQMLKTREQKAIGMVAEESRRAYRLHEGC